MVIIFVENVRRYVKKMMGKRALARFSDTELTCGQLRTKNG